MSVTVTAPRRLLAAALALALSALPALAAFETRATAAWVYDMTNDTVLYEKQADVPLPPASMSKVMTLYMLFEALKDGRVSLDTEFRVSDRAHAMGGSTLFLDQSDRPTVEDLIKGIVVQSGNDACVVVAEGLAGSEDAFARLMNERAPGLGLRHSTFTNSTGWPDPNHRMSMEDLGKVAVAIIRDFPEYYGYFALTEWPFDGRAPQNRFNRNPVLGLGIGADGLKTGHTQEAGYGLVGSAVQGNRRVVFVITGLETMAQRAEESEKIVSWAFRQFVERDLAKAGTVVTSAPVWMGDHTRVQLVLPEDVRLLVAATQRELAESRVEYRGPIEAPVAVGAEVATLVIPRDELPDMRVPLVSDREVVRGGFLPRIRSAAITLFNRAAGEALAFR
jgi:serine-type D-Ala-D-Ala carboxypeptidase (penicillin-binding protein 5/6)